MVPGTTVVPWYEYIYIRGCCCCLFCVNCFSSSFFVCRPHFCHIFTERSSLYSFLLPKTTHKKRRTNKASRVKVCSVRFRALWSSPRVPSLVLIQEERRTEKRRRRTATRSSREEQEQEEKERCILRTIPTIGTMLPNARQLEIIMTIKELRKTEEKR